MRIFLTTPAPAITAGASASTPKSSEKLFGQLMAGASQAASAHPAVDADAQVARARPPSGDAEFSQSSQAQPSAQTSSQEAQSGSARRASVAGSAAPVAESSRLLLPPAALVALVQPATDLPGATAAELKPGDDAKAASSQTGKPVKDAKRHSSQQTEAGQLATANNQQTAATGPVPVLVSPALMSILEGGSIRGNGAQKALALPDLANLAAETNANSGKQAPQHATVEGSPTTESAADPGWQQHAAASAVQLRQENFALPAIASSTPTIAPSAPAGGVFAAHSGKESPKGSADLQSPNSSGPTTNGAPTRGSTPSGSKSDNSASSGTPAASSPTPGAHSGASSAQQANASHPAVLQLGGPANGAQPQVPMLYTLTQEAPRSSLEGAGAAPRPSDAHRDVLEHLGDPAEPARGMGIDSARLIQTMNRTEMQVGMHSADFGNISIRASLGQQQMMAQISVNHDELSQAMMAHLSTVQTKIGNDYGLQASISVHHQGAATAGHSGGQSYQQQQHPNARSSRAIDPVQPSLPEMIAHPMPAAAADAGYRLDIQV